MTECRNILPILTRLVWVPLATPSLTRGVPGPHAAPDSPSHSMSGVPHSPPDLREKCKSVEVVEFDNVIMMDILWRSWYEDNDGLWNWCYEIVNTTLTLYHLELDFAPLRHLEGVGGVGAEYVRPWRPPLLPAVVADHSSVPQEGLVHLAEETKTSVLRNIGKGWSASQVSSCIPFF